MTGQVDLLGAAEPPRTTVPDHANRSRVGPAGRAPVLPYLVEEGSG